MDDVVCRGACVLDKGALMWPPPPPPTPPPTPSKPKQEIKEVRRKARGARREARGARREAPGARRQAPALPSAGQGCGGQLPCSGCGCGAKATQLHLAAMPSCRHAAMPQHPALSSRFLHGPQPRISWPTLQRGASCDLRRRRTRTTHSPPRACHPRHPQPPPCARARSDGDMWVNRWWWTTARSQCHVPHPSPWGRHRSTAWAWRRRTLPRTPCSPPSRSPASPATTL